MGHSRTHTRKSQRIIECYAKTISVEIHSGTEQLSVSVPVTLPPPVSLLNSIYVEDHTVIYVPPLPCTPSLYSVHTHT